ncbi:hypothetical protein P43SY_011157 [Pythium insidiosum]|uniref:MULE transposase domain-containing protein n=1 Tax=Pythium insidiosum TaxID=114742 RepID=A0AAD5Q434_PYTIN|nr:hypothetical protein P43SY_011157 [Pythium insidiosum]
MDAMNAMYPDVPLRAIAKTPGITIVKNARAAAFGHDIFRVIETAPVRNVSYDDERPFLRFNIAIGVQGDRPRRLIGFAHPDLVRILCYPKLALFIDGTFKGVPNGFSQYVIVMAYDPPSDLYVPIFFVLAGSKDQTTYWRILNAIIINTKLRLGPGSVTWDFEQALIRAVLDQFPTVDIVGCLFHWKQALRRKMIDIGLTVEDVKTAMIPGQMDVLTLVPEDEILDKGIRFVRYRIDETWSKRKWDQFWTYFQRTWITRFDPSLWNIGPMLAHSIPIIKRTNNPLERYNRDRVLLQHAAARVSCHGTPLCRFGP